MSFEILKKELKENKLRSCYFFYGEEQYLKNYYLQTLIKKIVEAPDDFNCYKIDAKALDMSELTDICESYPLTCDKKAVIISDLNIAKLSKSDFDFFCKLLNELPEYTVIIIYEQTLEIDEKSAIFKAFYQEATKANGLFCHFKKQSEGDLASWCSRQFKAHNKIISSKLIYYLLSLCDNSMTTLKTEIQKLCSYCVTEEITKQQIDAVITKTVDARVFDLTDAVIKNNTEAVFMITDELFAQAIEPTLIAGTVFSFFIRLYKVKTALVKGMSKNDIISNLGIAEYPATICIQQCRGISQQALKECLLCCQKADMALKSSKMNNRTVIERLLGEILLVKDR
ncbi:MAG: DNA polymerase III subunit delta [Ruminococcaceae bacterium]|nr:DNA polymerase III subunit delta [Oscillospiraceae bacterium]